MNTLAAPLLFLVFLRADDKPTPKLPLGKETTYITEPLDTDGYLDYEAALNDRLGKGITPEKNANVLIWKAIGPRPEGGKGMPAEFFKRMGMDEPPEKGEYFIELKVYVKDHLKLKDAEVETVLEDYRFAMQRPWTAKDYPHIDNWLKLNEKPLALVVEASKRPNYFNPLVFRRSEDGLSCLIGALLTGVYQCREIAGTLACRAMLQVQEGKFDVAWEDLLTCHRLGRLVSRGGIFIEGATATTIDGIASRADLAYLEQAGLTAKQVKDRLRDLQALPPMSPIGDKADLAERFTTLDSTQLIRRGGMDVLWAIAGTLKHPVKVQPLETLEWELILRNVNAWFDRTVAGLRLKDRAEREKELDKINRDFRRMAGGLPERMNGFKLAFGKDPPEIAVSKLIGDLIIKILFPPCYEVCKKYDRCEQLHRNLRIAFALAAYHSDNGRYPAKLDDLAPNYLPAVPDDLYSGKALIYRPSEKGYLFYSVGPNGKDEGGRSERSKEEDISVGDDIPVCMPLPEWKRKK